MTPYNPMGWYSWRNGLIYEQRYTDKMSVWKIAEHWQLGENYVRDILKQELKRRVNDGNTPIPARS